MGVGGNAGRAIGLDPLVVAEAGAAAVGDDAELARRSAEHGAGGVDGAVVGNVFGTYLHGPVLARNPEFADLLLERALGRELSRVNDPLADQYAAWRRAVIK